MNRLKLFIVVGFGLMFLAGLEVGRSHTTLASLKGDLMLAVNKVTGHPAPPPATQPAPPQTPPLLFGEIQITPAQDEQVRAIFHEAHGKTDALSRQFRDFDRQRADKIQALLDPMQQIEYEAIDEEHEARAGDVRSQIGAIMTRAGDAVRSLLTPEQQVKYDAVRKRFDEERGRRGGPPWRGSGRHPRGDAQTQPSASAPATGPSSGPN